MGFHELQQKLFINLATLLLIIFALTPPALSITTTPPNFPITKPNCTDRCGNINIPYPFGTTENCYGSPGNFFVICKKTHDNSSKLFFNDSSVEITSISIHGQLTVLSSIQRDCYDSSGGRMEYPSPKWITLTPYLTASNTANKFTVVGCDTQGLVAGTLNGDRLFWTGCSTMCFSKYDLMKDSSCSGFGCCQSSIPKGLRSLEIELGTYNNYSNVSADVDHCSYAFVVEESTFKFSAESINKLKNVTELPVVVDWAIGTGTCEDAQKNPTSYACKSVNSKCYKPDNGDGYRCSCDEGYEGNPYLNDGCQDINECQHPSLNNCERLCSNTNGSYECRCPEGYDGDGRKGGKGCSRGESLVLKLVAGIAVGVVVLLLAACWLHMELKRRRLIRMKNNFFYQNGGILLQEKLNRRENSSSDMAKIFNSSELQKATNKFDSSMIIGKGGFGTVYKGVLSENRIVAIKKSKEIDRNQIEQFINEVIILSRINHRNVVRLLGCCLETQVPLLVYEYISNGTLFENMHDVEKAGCLNWDTRLRIAAETAGVLSYLHSAASTPIIHRDVKSANILLDHTLTAKVSDFGASRLVPLDQTQLSTMVQGTFGYLDPEYLQTNKLTEKSDVYSFGVVLLELLTGRTAISFDKPEEEKNLANFFISMLKQERLFQVLDDNIVVGEENTEQIIEVARLAQGCLHVKGEDRPSMKEVAMELEGLRLGGKQSWAQTQHNAEETESLLGEGFNGFANGDGNSTSVGYDSLMDHVILPMSGGR